MRVDAGLRVADLRDDRGAAGRDGLREETDGRRLHVVHPGTQRVPACERLPGEEVAAGVDGHEVAAGWEEDAAGSTDRVEEVGELAVDVHGDTGVAEHVVLVE